MQMHEKHFDSRLEICSFAKVGNQAERQYGTVSLKTFTTKRHYTEVVRIQHWQRLSFWFGYCGSWPKEVDLEITSLRQRSPI